MDVAQRRIANLADQLGAAPVGAPPTPRKVYRTELNPVSFLKRAANVHPNQLAVFHPFPRVGNARSCTYSTMSDRVRRLSRAILNAGVRQGDVVAVLAPNIPATLECFYACPLVQAPLVAINTRLHPNEIDYIVTFSEARLLFVDRELVPLVTVDPNARVLQSKWPNVKLVVIEDTGDPQSDEFERFLFADRSPAPAWDTFPELEDEEQTITINFTSGTTGKPKGVMLTYRGAYLNALGELMEMGMDYTSGYLWILPMFHASGWCFPWTTSACCAVNVCLRKVDPDQIWDLLLPHGKNVQIYPKITHYCGAPTVQISLVNHKKARRLPHPIKTMVAGAPPSPTLIAKMESLQLVMIHTYGLTESYGPTTVQVRQPHWNKLKAAERAALLSRQGQNYIVSDEVRVVDPQLKDTPWDGKTAGEVVMKGNILMSGYLKDPKATEAAFSGGVFHTGDLGVRHPDGNIELQDRKKDIIISGGENISTIEVEATIAACPIVLECAVVATPDAKWGERPVAFVVLKSAPHDAHGEQHAQDTIMKHCRTKIAGFKVPVRVDIVVELPKTSTGKIQKFKLKEMEWKRWNEKNGDATKKRIH